MTPTQTALANAMIPAMKPLEIRKLVVACIEQLMSESDDAHDAYSAAFDALDDPATVAVFEDQPDLVKARRYIAMLAEAEMSANQIAFAKEETA